MTMKVQFNADSQFALRHLNQNVFGVSKALSRISSGEKIHSAGDNPSMYAITEKMRERIRSLDQDELNVQNGSSMLSSAERGVNQIVDILRHMKSLAVNSANDHNIDTDRAIIQKEYESNLATINDIVFNTKFNGRVLLDGRYERPVSHYPATADNIVNSFSAGANVTTTSGSGTKTIGSASYAYENSFNGSNFSVKLDFSDMTAEGSSYPDALHGKGFAILCGGCNQFINVVFDASKNVNQSTYNANPDANNSLAHEYIIGVKNVTDKNDLAQTIFDGVAASRDLSGDSFVIDKHDLGMKRDGNDIFFTKKDNLAMMFTNEIIPTKTSELTFTERDSGPLWIQDGTLAGQHINTYIKSMQTKDMKGEIFNESDMAQLRAISDPTERAEYRALLTKADSMTLDDVSLATREDARVGMRVIDGALDYALDEQTSLGAYVQRLKYVDENIMTMSANTQAAESGIRDADIAREMVSFANFNILSQASQFMLAQSNQRAGAVLRLLGLEQE